MTSIQIDVRDGLSSSTAIKGPVKAASTGNLTLSGEQTIDGVTIVTGDRVLVKDQTTGSENGIWICDTGAWRRSRDFNKTKDVASGTQIWVNSGATNQGLWRLSTADPIAVETTNITFARSMLTSSNNLGDIADKVMALGNLNYQRVAGNSTYAIMSAPTKMSQRADLRDWNGLDLTGTNDMATLVQAAVNATAAAGAKLNVPGGKIALGSTVTVPQFANIEGAGSPATGFSGTVAASSLTFFHLAHLGVGFNLLGANNGPRRVSGFGTYRDQTTPGVGWAPISALADVQLQGVYDTCVEDIFFSNPTVAVNVVGATSGPEAGAGNGRFTLRRLRGQALTFGIHITHVYDTIYIDDIHWWPYWSRDTNVLAYTRSTAKSMLFGRVDWPMVGRVFSWGMADGLYIQNQASVGFDAGLPAGTTTHMHIDTLGVDACQRGLVTEAGSSGVSVSIDRLTCTNDTYASSAQITLAGDNSRITIKDLYGANTDGNLVSMGGTGNDLKIGMSRSSGIDHDASGTPEFNVATGNTLTLATKPITSAGTVYAFAGTGRIRTPDWINFTPTVTASTGTITTVATIAAGDCKYKLEGTTCTFDYTVTITTNGTGAGVVQMTLPFAAKKIGNASGKVAAVNIGGLIQAALGRIDVTKYDGTYPGADGAVLRISGAYEIA